ncbi:hypothetical protein [Chamaesiphon minutus]|uniref:Uncharacterized protein n=1 Tax=Chamaesiphon minutus (strain ATCC 27169 / PCC 6605) TaxID=1173020 RepID=K9UAD1_CHAP6|nr:hypothetical protein [Chamaesiphon minutus]AFY92077.1 hypothetical protein Cha6605_0810 [Chamaesiphon minutus PCC 6605]
MTVSSDRERAVRRSLLNKLLNRNNHSCSPVRWYRLLASTAIVWMGCWGQSLPSVATPASVDRQRVVTPARQTVNSIAQQPAPENNTIDISPEILNSSPVLQKWLKGIPDVADDIRNDPSFRTRFKLGYSQYPSTAQTGGVHLAVDDVFFGRSGLSASANYNSGGSRSAYGIDAQYYLLPLGGYINITPLVGFRRLQTDKYNRDGLNLGLKLMLVPSRGGGADIALSQSWVGLGSDTETGLTTFSVGYAITNNLRISTDIQQQNARENYDSRVGIGVEWMP